MAALLPRHENGSRYRFSSKDIAELRVLLGVGPFAVFMGGVCVCAALDLLPSAERPEPVGRILILLFGAFILFVGAGMLHTALRRTVDASDLQGSRLWIAVPRLLLSRVNKQSCADAAPYALLVAEYALVLSGIHVPLLPGSDDLMAVMVVEFLAIHSVPFLAAAWVFAVADERSLAGAPKKITSILATPASWKAPQRFVPLALIGSLYLIMAFGHGIYGAMLFLYLTASRFLPLRRTSEQIPRLVCAAVRWALQFFALMLASLPVEDRSFRSPETLHIGLGYFVLLLLIELVRLPDIGQVLAPWRRGVPEAGLLSPSAD